MYFSRTFKSSSYCLTSPDGRLIATLLPPSIIIRLVETLQTVHSVELPKDLAGLVSALRWAPSSSKILVAVADQVHVFSVLDSEFHAVVRNPTAASGPPTFTSFGASDSEVVAFSSFGLKVALFNLSTSKTVEIGSPKFYHASSAPRTLSFRPGTSHMALLTRTGGKDVVAIHHPTTREVQRSWQPDTIDAQGLIWTADGRWLVIWESPAHGCKVLFYTPDGHLFRAWIGWSDGSTAEKREAELGAGVKFCQVSPDGGHVAVCDHSRCIALLDATAVTESAKLRHPLTVMPRDTLQIWQEQISLSRTGSPTHSFVRASQTVYPPGKLPGSNAAEAKAGCASASFDSSSGLLATKLEESPSTVWIWDLSVAELRAVLIFHANVSDISWHPCIRELLLVSCEGDDHSGVVFAWDPLYDGPKCIDFTQRLPGHHVVGRAHGAWLGLDAESGTIHFSDSKAFLLASLTESGSPPFSTKLSEYADGDDFSSNVASAGLDQEIAGLGDDDVSEIDDTFSFKK